MSGSTQAGAASRLARLLALVPWLTARDGIALEDAAREFGVTVPELERDLWLLIVCGLPGYGPADLVDIQFWDDGRIHVIDPQTLVRPLRLTATEATALALGLRVLAQVPGAVSQDAVARVAAKLDAAIESGAALPERAMVAIGIPDADVAAAIDTAVREGTMLEIRYASATRDEVTERVIVPLRVVSVDGRTSVVADCRLAGAVRTFRLDRILAAAPCEPARAGTAAQEASPTGSGPDTDGSAVAEGNAVAEGSAGTDVTDVTVMLGPEAVWLADAHATASDRCSDGSLRATFSVHDLRWLARAILMAGPAARVIGPPEAVTAVRRAAEEALGAYSGVGRTTQGP